MPAGVERFELSTPTSHANVLAPLQQVDAPHQLQAVVEQVRHVAVTQPVPLPPPQESVVDRALDTAADVTATAALTTATTAIGSNVGGLVGGELAATHLGEVTRPVGQAVGMLVGGAGGAFAGVIIGRAMSADAPRARAGLVPVAPVTTQAVVPAHPPREVPQTAVTPVPSLGPMDQLLSMMANVQAGQATLQDRVDVGQASLQEGKRL